MAHTDAVDRIDPLHQTSPPGTLWTTVNSSEAFPGVLTPLTWTFIDEPSERAYRGAFYDLGAFSRDMLVPATRDERFNGVFFGRYAGNVEITRDVADRMPGTSGDELELAILGRVRPGASSRPVRSRYPIVAVKLPWRMARVRRQIPRLREETQRWWRSTLDRLAAGDPDFARGAFLDARRRFEVVLRLHTAVSMVASGAYWRVHQVAAAADLSSVASLLMAGHGAIEETRLLADLWDLARGRVSEAVFLERHGYQGPNAGELESRPWREDAEPLRRLAAVYGEQDETRDPRRVERSRRAEREATERELFDRLRGRKRVGRAFLLRQAASLMSLRECGKATFLMAMDAARAAARILGRDLARRKLLFAEEDVWYLTVDELSAVETPVGLADRVEFRRERRHEYRRLELPQCWIGDPPRVEAAAPTGGGRAGETLTGVGAVGGVYEGRVRVVRDPMTTELEPGEILVASVTDPSWAPLLLLASAAVIDMGGPLSHAAIVARELGIPCVIAVQTGTTRLATGDRVRVDGSNGTVLLLEKGAP